jgi:drug/metabolite transporter superfamily protein YnfA
MEMPTAESMLNHIKAGGTIVVATYAWARQLDKKVLDRFEKVGARLLKQNGKDVFLARGKHWDCINGCSIRFYK